MGFVGAFDMIISLSRGNSIPERNMFLSGMLRTSDNEMIMSNANFRYDTNSCRVSEIDVTNSLTISDTRQELFFQNIVTEVDFNEPLSQQYQ